ncbi:MAG TPA: PhnD/SsuA/transferrin family substrate-binding protein, partial [Thermoguttaceae bacterium]|nr:PhnD/SsuA/transferrin family substrate-binding protein [Thermoguttaceae bacterium]
MAHPVSPLRVVVMDPLCKYLACDCAGDYAQREYDALEKYLQSQLRRPVDFVYSEALAAPHVGPSKEVDLIIGKYSVVAFDAAGANVKIRTLAMLTGDDGKVTQTGLFVVRTADPARSIADLADDQIIFGPKESSEKRAAAFAAVEAFELKIPDDVPTSSSCSTAALAVFENEADAAVISSYAM